MADNTGEAEPSDRERLIHEFWAAEKKVGEPIKVEVGRMVFGERQRTRDRKVADAFIKQLPHSARQTYEQGTEEYRLCDMYESLTVQGWDSSMPGFALKVGEGEHVKYKLLAGNTRYLMLDHLATAGNNDERYTHGWVRVVEDENDALLIALGHNLISETVRPPPDLEALKDVLVQRLKALKGSPQDFLRELGVGLQLNVASFVRKLLTLQTEVNAIPAEQANLAFYAKTLLQNLMEVVAEHIAGLSRGTKPKQSALTSKWSKINPKVPQHEGEEEGNGYRTLVDSPSEHSDKTLHYLARVEAFTCLVTPKIAKLSKTQSDVNWMILHHERVHQENQNLTTDDVHAALQSRLERLGVVAKDVANTATTLTRRVRRAADKYVPADAALGPQKPRHKRKPANQVLAAIDSAKVAAAAAAAGPSSSVEPHAKRAKVQDAWEVGGVYDDFEASPGVKVLKSVVDESEQLAVVKFVTIVAVAQETENLSCEDTWFTKFGALPLSGVTSEDVEDDVERADEPEERLTKLDVVPTVQCSSFSAQIEEVLAALMAYANQSKGINNLTNLVPRVSASNQT